MNLKPGQIRRWLRAGEEVVLTFRNRPVARLVPMEPDLEDSSQELPNRNGEKTPDPFERKIEWPDFKARQEAIFGKGVVFPDNPVLQERESYEW